MKHSYPKPISEIIQEMIDATGQKDNFDRSRVCYLWAEVAGPAINRYTARRYVDDSGAMHVYITSAALKNELTFLRETLVRQLNEAAGAQVIKSLVIH